MLKAIESTECVGDSEKARLGNAFFENAFFENAVTPTGHKYRSEYGAPWSALGTRGARAARQSKSDERKHHAAPSCLEKRKRIVR